MHFKKKIKGPDNLLTLECSVSLQKGLMGTQGRAFESPKTSSQQLFLMWALTVSPPFVLH